MYMHIYTHLHTHTHTRIYIVHFCRFALRPQHNYPQTYLQNLTHPIIHVDKIQTRTLLSMYILQICIQSPILLFMYIVAYLDPELSLS